MTLKGARGETVETYHMPERRRELFEAIFGHEALKRTAEVAFGKVESHYACRDGRCVMSRMIVAAGVPFEEPFPSESEVIAAMDEADRVPPDIELYVLEQAIIDMISLNDHGALTTTEAVKEALGLA